MLTGAIVYRSDLAFSVCRWREQHRIPEEREKEREEKQEGGQTDRQTGRECEVKD